MLLENTRSHLADLLDQLDDGAVTQLGTGVAELAEGGESRVGLTEDGVTVTGHDTADLRVDQRYSLICSSEAFSPTASCMAKRPAENSWLARPCRGPQDREGQPSTRGKGPREPNRPSGSVGRNVTTLVVTVDGNVETEVVGHTLVVAVANHVGVVADQVEVRVDGLLAVTTAKDVVVDTSGQSRAAWQ